LSGFFGNARPNLMRRHAAIPEMRSRAWKSSWNH